MKCDLGRGNQDHELIRACPSERGLKNRVARAFLIKTRFTIRSNSSENFRFSDFSRELSKKISAKSPIIAAT